MRPTITRFTFDNAVPMPEVEATLRLALLAMMSLFGEDRVRAEVCITLNRDERFLIIEATPDISQALAQVFGAYIRQEFGADAINPVRSSALGSPALTGAGA